MKRPAIAALLNFFFMGAGTLYVGRRKALGAALTLAALALTYVELQVKVLAPAVYPVMFAAVFLMNSFLAWDGLSEARAVNAKP
jgi:hypothetical protein